MKWTEMAWLAVKPSFDAITELPFIKELSQGSLDREKFLFYIEQDSIYLASYGKLLTGLASRLDRPEHRRELISFAGENMDQERELHKLFINQINPTAEASPTCLLYTSYLLKHLATSPVEIAFAAVMPCFRVYLEVGLHIAKQKKIENNPYQAWIDTYSEGEHLESVKRAEAICNALVKKASPELQEEMLRTYKLSTKLEYLFWDSAYRLEKWPI